MFFCVLVDLISIIFIFISLFEFIKNHIHAKNLLFVDSAIAKSEFDLNEFE